MIQVPDKNGVMHDLFNLPTSFEAKELRLGGLDLSNLVLPKNIKCKNINLVESHIGSPLDLSVFEAAYIYKCDCTNLFGFPSFDLTMQFVDNINADFNFSNTDKVTVAHCDGTGFNLTDGPRKKFLVRNVHNLSGVWHLGNTEIAFMEDLDMKNVCVPEFPKIKAYLQNSKNWSGVLDLSKTLYVYAHDADFSNVDKIILGPHQTPESIGLGKDFPANKIVYGSIKFREYLTSVFHKTSNILQKIPVKLKSRN